MILLPFKTTNSLSVIGDVSASNLFFDKTNNSSQWSSTYTLVNQNSASWDSNFNADNLKKTTVNLNFNADKFNYYLVDTSLNSIICILPNNPQIGDHISFQDRFLTWNTNNFIISSITTDMIQGIDHNLICDLKGLNITLTYISNSFGWRVD